MDKPMTFLAMQDKFLKDLKYEIAIAHDKYEYGRIEYPSLIKTLEDALERAHELNSMKKAREKYILVSVKIGRNIYKRMDEGEADSLEDARKMAYILLDNKPDISMVEIIEYNSGHFGERHVIPRQRIPYHMMDCQCEERIKND